MVKFDTFLQPEEILEMSRDNTISKIEIRTINNKTLAGDKVNCIVYLNMFSGKKLSKERPLVMKEITASLLKSARDKKLNKKEREKAGGYYSMLSVGNSPYLSISKWNEIFEFELRNKVTLDIPNRIREAINEIEK